MILLLKMIQVIFSFIDEYNLKTVIGATLDLSHIGEACIAIDNGKMNGKIVVSA